MTTLRRLHRRQDGAAAVEFALVVPVLILLVVGIIEFAWAFNQQIEMTSAAREGARYMAIHYTDPDAVAATRQRVRDAAPALDPPIADGQITVGSCTPDQPVTVAVAYPHTPFTGMFANLTNINLRGEGVMRCGG